MPVFAYKATDEHGRVVDGQIEAKDHAAVIDRLHQLSFYPLEIKAAEKSIEETGLPLSTHFRKGKRVVFFTGQLATLLEAGMPVDKSLSIMEELTDDRHFTAVIGRVRTSIEEGSTLAESLRNEPEYFNDLYVNMIKAGESGGVLEIILRRLSDFLEESQRIKDFVISSLTYPIFLMLFSAVALIIIFVSVLPRFAEIFSDMGDVIPLPAVVLMGISNFLGTYWWMLLVGLLAIAMGIRSWVKTVPGRLWWDKNRLSWPVVGSLTTRLATARFARTLGTLMNSGVPILQAVDVVGEIMNNRHLSSFMVDIKNGLKKGEGLVSPLRRSKVFPPLFIHMVSVGEETGRLEEMLIKVAAIFEREVETATKGLLSLLEPVILVFLGIILGGIILSVLWAIYSVYSVSF